MAEKSKKTEKKNRRRNLNPKMRRKKSQSLRSLRKRERIKART